jgi:ornithine cyclodeaminase/alanine dehydrogenase-like protein (mu-crystallin family)
MAIPIVPSVPINLSEQRIRELANLDEVIAAIHAAFTRDFSSTLRMPVRTSLDLAGGAVLLLMPCYDSALSAAGVKTVTVSREAGVQAAYELLDPATGRALARMEANFLTDLRTAATSALATDLLARPDVQTLGVFGSGRQAVAHFTVLPRVRKFRRFLVCGSGRRSLQAFCAAMKQDHEIEIEPVDAATCARESDVLCTCTTSSTPLFDGTCLQAGAHLNLVGAFQPHTREVDDETARRSRIVVDTYHGALAEAGDLLIPLKTNVIKRAHIVADLHEIASGKKQGRTGYQEVTLFKSVGCALEDLVTAELIYRKIAISK